MAEDVGGNIGQRLVALALHAAGRNNVISLATVTRVDLQNLKVDVVMKNTKDTNLVELYACPILSQSYSGGGQINIPRKGDLVVVIYSKYNIEDQIKKGSLAINNIDERNVLEQNYGIVIGTIYTLPENELDLTRPPKNPDPAPPVQDPTEDNLRTIEQPRKNAKGEILSHSGEYINMEDYEHTIWEDPEIRFNRPPVPHPEKTPRLKDKRTGDKVVDQTERFVNGIPGDNRWQARLEPQPYHQIWYHPYDHEIRMTRQEIFIKHKTGTQIICREAGDLVIYVWKTMNVHAKGNITIESEQRAMMASFVPPKNRPWRVDDSEYHGNYDEVWE